MTGKASPGLSANRPRGGDELKGRSGAGLQGGTRPRGPGRPCGSAVTRFHWARAETTLPAHGPARAPFPTSRWDPALRGRGDGLTLCDCV